MSSSRGLCFFPSLPTYAAPAGENPGVICANPRPAVTSCRLISIRLRCASSETSGTGAARNRVLKQKTKFSGSYPFRCQWNGVLQACLGHKTARIGSPFFKNNPFRSLGRQWVRGGKVPNKSEASGEAHGDEMAVDAVLVCRRWNA